MKILYDFQIFQIQKYGGISRYFFRLLQSISEFPNVEIYLFQGLNQSGFDWRAQRSLWRRSISVSVPQQLAKSSWITAVNYAGLYLFQLLMKRPDILHLTYYPHKILRPKGTKLVVSLYDMIQELYPEYYANEATIGLKRKALFEADLILCISESSRKDLLTFYEIDPEKARVVYLGPTFDSKTLLSENRDHITFPTKRPFMLYVGLRDSHKNFQAAVMAYSGDRQLVKDFDLLCFGSIPFSASERDLLKKTGIEKNTYHIAGTDRVLWFCYRQAHLFIYPSLYEGFGFPLLEAMTAGCPIVASCRGSIPEIMGRAGVLFDPRDESSIADAIKKLAYDETLRQDLVKKGYARAKEFSWERAAKETHAAYLDILS